VLQAIAGTRADPVPASKAEWALGKRLVIVVSYRSREQHRGSIPQCITRMLFHAREPEAVI
jgi:hypothetical protein